MQATAVVEGPSEKEKKVRGLQKKLRQIEQLKQRQSAGETLQANQVSGDGVLDVLAMLIPGVQLEKVSSEASVKEELMTAEAQ